MQYTHQADIKPHIAIKNMAELMGYHTLQLITAQVFDRSLGNTDDCVTRREPCREGVDSLFVGEQIHRWRRRARGDCHFLNHIQQLALFRIPGILRYQPSTQGLRNSLAPC